MKEIKRAMQSIRTIEKKHSLLINEIKNNAIYQSSSLMKKMILNELFSYQRKLENLYNKIETLKHGVKNENK